ncbi:MAG: PhoH family protein, partial [Planctomycetota bacterium]
MRKTYILDANILLHDPHSIFRFVDNDVLIPIEVISEVDRFKRESTDRGYNARQVVRLLDGLRAGRSLMEGVTLEGGGRLRVTCDRERVLTGANGAADVEILRLARRVQDEQKHQPVVIVTKDVNLRIRADAAGLRAEDYESDQVPLSELYTGQVEHDVSVERLQEFRDRGEITLDELDLSPGEYVLLRVADGSRGSALGRADVDGRTVRTLREVEGKLWGIQPRNKEQYFAIDALLDERIKLVTLMGKAGTGKTLLALAAGMYLVVRRKRYRGLLVGRPVVPMGRDLGYLPGDVSRKLQPWMKPITDAVEFLWDAGGPVRGFRGAESLIDSGVLEIQPLTYIRGRSIGNRFVIIDEAQNLTPLEVKTVITRIGLGSKVVLTGDPYQI